MYWSKHLGAVSQLTKLPMFLDHKIHLIDGVNRFQYIVLSEIDAQILSTHIQELKPAVRPKSNFNFLGQATSLIYDYKK